MLHTKVLGEDIRGFVRDSKAKEPIIGATIKIIGTGKGTRSGLDGSYKIKNVTVGKITVSASCSGYLQFDTVIIVTDQDIILDIPLSYHMVSAGELTVTAKAEKGSDAEAQQTERNSDNVISAVSAKTIEVSPDISVANVSQRVSGVSMTRTSNGDAQYAIIRGMDKRYNYTTVNGIKIPSPDNKNRYVPLDIFPAELLDRLEVTKSLLPSMEGDAIGGAMNLVMKQAPDKLLLFAKVASGYDGLYFSRKFYDVNFSATSQSPRVVHGDNYVATLADFPLANFNPSPVNPSLNQYYALTYGDRHFEDQSLGIIVSATFQRNARGANSIFFPTTANQQTSLPDLTDLNNRTFSTLQTRTGAMTNIDYRLGEYSTIQLFGMYANLKSLEVRDQFDTVLGLGWPKTVRIDYSRRVTQEDQGIGNITLSGNHDIFGKDLELHWDLVYSRASLSEPDRSTLNLYGGQNQDSSGKYVIVPYLVNSSGGSGSPRVWTNNIDQDKCIYLTLKSTENVLGILTEFLYGGMYRNKLRSAAYDSYELQPNNRNTIQGYNGNVLLDTFTVFNPGGSNNNPLNYDAHENISAGFLQFKFQIGQLLTIGGVRIENTDFGWASQAPDIYPGKTGTIQYLDILPSVSFKYMPVDNQNWRLSYFRSISRPNYYELVPNNGVPGEDYKEISNPYLNRTQASNIDLRWEYFPGGLDQILLGAFFKNIQDPIEYTVVDSLTNTYFQPRNWGTATNLGFEVDLRKYFSHFGIQANYTFTSSHMTTDKKVDYRDPSRGLTFRLEEQTRPLQGQSAHIGNFSLLYKDLESGTDAQLGLVYTGPAIVGVSPYKDDDVWANAIAQIDFSAEQRILEKLAIYFKVNNILNTPREEVIHQTYVQGIAPIAYQTVGQNILVRREYYDRTYTLGFRFKL